MEKPEEAFVCPFCGGPYRELIPAGVVQVKCRYCGVTVLVPPRLGGLVKRCPNHPETLAIGFCNDCKNRYCGRCLHILEEQTRFNVVEIHVCPDCLSKRRTKKIWFSLMNSIPGFIGGLAVSVVLTHNALAGILTVLFLSGPFWIQAWYYSSPYWTKPTVYERTVTIEETRTRIKEGISRLKAGMEPSEKELYEKLGEAYLKAWGARGKQILESKIEAYIKYGLSREEAILKVAKDEGYLRI